MLNSSPVSSNGARSTGVPFSTATERESLALRVFACNKTSIVSIVLNMSPALNLLGDRSTMPPFSELNDS